MYRSCFRLSTSPARRRMSRWWDKVGPGISTASWISPTDRALPAFTRTKKTWSRLRCARALNASTWLSSADSCVGGSRAIVFIFRSIWKYQSRVNRFRWASGAPGRLDPDVVLPGEHARLKGTQTAREHEAERADEREGRVHLRRAQHLPVAKDQMAEARLGGDELDRDQRDQRQAEAEPEPSEDGRERGRQ